MLRARLLIGVASVLVTTLLSLPSAASAITLVKPYSTGTVFFVTDQRPSAKGEAENGFDDDRYTFDIGPCAQPQPAWTDDCGLHYGYVQWDTADRPYYTALSAEDFYAAIGQPAHALIFIHGFDKRFSDAIRNGRQFVGWLDHASAERGDVPVIVYGWPATAATLSRLTFREAYSNDETNNTWSGLHLLAFFREFRSRSPGTRVTIVAHSMGNRLALNMLLSLRDEQLARAASFPGVASFTPAYRVAHFIAFEPDVDTQTFAESIAVVGQAAVEDVTVYGNPDDRALGVSAHAHGHCRAGLITCEPLYADQFSGAPMPAWLNVIDARMLARACDPVFHHSYYATSSVVLDDVTGLVLDTTKPMTPTSTRAHMQYSGEMSGKPLPHYWVDAQGCQ
jgi:esterase/lipase superfamily enzyme